MAYFCQLVIGPPGCGKSSYCGVMQEFLKATGRGVSIVNLDPANDSLLYKCDIDISELITLEDAMEKLKLGPNGGLIYCMEFLEKNIDWLRDKMNSSEDKYFLLDCPGQVELFTHHQSVKNVALKLQEWNFKVSEKFISYLFYSLCSSSQYIWWMLIFVAILGNSSQLFLLHYQPWSRLNYLTSMCCLK